jgi:hypothetical protein
MLAAGLSVIPINLCANEDKHMILLGITFILRERGEKVERLTSDQTWALRRKIRESGVKNYELAEALGVCESALSKRMRSPSKDQAREISAALDQLKKKRG